MRNSTLRTLGFGFIVAIWLCLCLWAWLRTPDVISQSERRKLAQFPQFSTQTVLNGSFSSGFESYATDQFPLRESFRGIKAVFHMNLLGQLTNNDIYYSEAHAAKLEYPLNIPSVQYAAERFNSIYRQYLADSHCRILLSIVPDKGYYLTPINGYPAPDYTELTNIITQATRWADYIHLFDALDPDDYYRTDSHWRQERLLEAANLLCDALDIAPASNQAFTQVPLEKPFYGVYRGQIALPLPADRIVMLQNETVLNCKVFNYESGKYTSVYDMQKLTSPDLYDIFLSGPTALLRIENPDADNSRELIVFRDSFGSSIIPLLLHGYQTVTVVDLRYISSDLLGKYLSFRDQDVLFLYSVTLLNQSSAIK